MENVASVMHRIIYDALDEACLARVVLGRVTSLAPLEVQLEQKIYLREKQLVLTEHTELKAGTKLAMIRIQGDERYLVIGNIV